MNNLIFYCIVLLIKTHNYYVNGDCNGADCIPIAGYNYSYQLAQNYKYQYHHVYPVITTTKNGETIQSVGPPQSTSNFETNSYSAINYETNDQSGHKKYAYNNTANFVAPNVDIIRVEPIITHSNPSVPQYNSYATQNNVPLSPPQQNPGYRPPPLNTGYQIPQQNSEYRPIPPPLIHHSDAEQPIKYDTINNEGLPSIPLTNECELQEIPNNGSVSLEIYPLVNLETGDYVANQRNIIYKCEKSYQLLGNNINKCLNGKWQQRTPNCQKAFCTSDHFNSITNQVHCFSSGKPIGCDSATSGAIAKISCSSGYRKPNINLPNVIECRSNNEWNYGGYRCEDVCGITTKERNYFPWQIRVFRSTNTNHQMKQICSGSIINANVILSAAHCFQDSNRQQFLHRDLFSVIAGGFTRQSPIQNLKIDNMLIPDHSQNADIVVLILQNSIIFTDFIAPVCLGYGPFVTNENFGNVIGKFSIFESRTTTEAAIQKIVDIQINKYNENVKTNNDKLCGKGYNAPTPLAVYDGTGLVINIDNTYHLRGIFTKIDGNCLVFTDLNHYITSISRHGNQNRPK